MPQPKIEKTKNTFSFLILHTSYGTLKYAQEILNHIQILLLKLLDIPFSEEEDVAASWLEKSNATCQWIVICIYVQLVDHSTISNIVFNTINGLSSSGTLMCIDYL